MSEGTPQVHIDTNWRTRTDQQLEALASFIEEKLRDDTFYSKFTRRIEWIYDPEQKKLICRRDSPSYSFSLNNSSDVGPLCKLFADNFPDCLIYSNTFYGSAGPREYGSMIGAGSSWGTSYAYHTPEHWFDPYEEDRIADFLVSTYWEGKIEPVGARPLPVELGQSFLNDLKKVLDQKKRGTHHIRVSYRRRVEVRFVSRHYYSVIQIYSTEIIDGYDV